MKACEFAHTDLALRLNLGQGYFVVQGTHTAEDNLPAVAVYELDKPGKLGDPVPEDTPCTLRLVISCPTLEQAKALFEAMAPVKSTED